MHEHEHRVIQTVKALDARQHWDSLLRTVSRKEARVVVEENGRPVAAIVSMDDLARLTTLEGDVFVSESPALPQGEVDAALAANRVGAEKTRALLAPPSPEEVERRRAIAAQIRSNRPYRAIAPLTAADLIHEARAQEEAAYGQPR
ncbi:MAG: type II toxin-antitoxin system prevent-host-death family antitoxin [Dehalococcoidia bacterium]